MRRSQYNAEGRQQPVGGPVGMLVRGVAAGIGLASESYHHHKEKKASNTQAGRDAEDATAIAHEGHELEHDARLSKQMDEAVWELDEAQDEVTDNSIRPAAATEEEVAGLANSFLIAHPNPPPYSSGQLALPVVITQRRPGSRTKGFARAYSPLLADVGIDQTTFLDFLNKLNKSVEPSAWIQAINLASFAGQAVPEPFTIIISMAVKKVADAASELHSRSKTNRFLDEVNESFFAPRGLVALVMTWKPSQRGDMLTRAEFDMQSSMTKASDNSTSRRMFESSSGATSFEWPETAPLLFPALDDLADAEDDGGKAKKQSTIKRSGKFVEEYMDKRARAKWAGENPDSDMANAMGQEKFSSRYADPNHPASSGDPIALLTGGYLQGFGRQLGNGTRDDMRGGFRGLQSPMGLGRSRLEGWQRGRESPRGDTLPGRQDLLGLGRGRDDGWQRGSQSSSAGGRGGLVGSGIGPLSLISGAKKLLQNDVLYLMIVQRPTEDQMAEAMERMNILGQARH